MSKYESLYRLLDKDSLSVNELRKLSDNELVVSIVNTESNKKLFYKYDVKLDNGELYFVYVKKSISELLKIFNSK